MTGRMKILLAAAALAALSPLGCQKAGDGLGLDTSGRVIPLCQLNPQDPSCVAADPCILNPAGPGCVQDTCLSNPQAPGCAVDPCLANAAAEGCKPKITFAQVLPLFEANYCLQCHLVGGQGYSTGGLLLSADSAYADLVDALVVNQTTAPGFVRVKPGFPDSSVLYMKIAMPSPKLPTGRYYGARMPQGRPAMDSASINLIKQWILDGALK